MILVADYFSLDASFDERASLAAMRAVAWDAGDRFYRQGEDDHYSASDFALGKDGRFAE